MDVGQSMEFVIILRRDLMENLDQGFNDLYLLQEAACGVKHGIRTSKWEVFEPTKFIYSYFAFNTFYSINWIESIKNKEINYWPIGSTTKDKEDSVDTDDKKSSPSESKKFYEMQKYIYKSYNGKIKGKNQEDGINEELAVKLYDMISLFLGEPLCDSIGILESIQIDDRINKDKKDQFLRHIQKIANREVMGGKLFDSWNIILHFVFLVRNNVFHGSKRIDTMQNGYQKERFRVYTAILLATNELLFDSIERDFGWRNHSKKRVMNYVRDENRLKFNIKSFKSIYNIKLPNGILFYPCCGDDTYEPIMQFRDTATEFHFVDINRVPRFPKLECDNRYRRVTGRNNNKNEQKEVIPSSLIERLIERQRKETSVDKSNIERLKQMGIQSTGFRGQVTISKKEIWESTISTKSEIMIYGHKQDGLIKFLEFDEIGVFYLRGDSLGEGGSGQQWFQPKLFDLILDKLVDGGFIVTDGSGQHYETRDIVPWKNLWKGIDFSDPDSKPDDFIYRERYFSCIGKCGERYGPVFLWKVNKVV